LFRLRVTLNDRDTNGERLADWEEPFPLTTFGVPPRARGSDSDGVYDLQEFQLGLQPGKKDNRPLAS
jgi:hypothetical protein